MREGEEREEREHRSGIIESNRFFINNIKGKI
jgi:hypothetical protein